MRMEYKKAKMQDLEEVHQLFQAATNEMNRIGISQWDEIYPNKEVLQSDIEKNQMWIGKKQGEIAVVWVINQEMDEQYYACQWSCGEQECRVLHRLCVHPKFQNARVGSTALAYLENSLKDAGVKAVRLDAFSKNPYALRMYERAGYVRRGRAVFRKGEFALMEKIL